MGRSKMTEDGHEFVAMRMMGMSCLLLLMPLLLRDSVLGMLGTVVALVWMGTLGSRSARLWASARGKGSSYGEAAAQARASAALTVLVAAVTSVVLIGAALRRFSPIGEWIESAGVAMPVVGVVALFVGAIPVVIAVIAVARLGEVGHVKDEQPDPTENVQMDPVRRTHGLMLLIAAGVGMVNVTVLMSVTPLGQWVLGTISERLAASAALLVAAALPAVTTWYLDRSRGSRS